MQFSVSKTFHSGWYGRRRGGGEGGMTGREPRYKFSYGSLHMSHFDGCQLSLIWLVRNLKELTA